MPLTITLKGYDAQHHEHKIKAERTLTPPYNVTLTPDLLSNVTQIDLNLATIPEKAKVNVSLPDNRQVTHVKTIFTRQDVTYTGLNAAFPNATITSLPKKMPLNRYLRLKSAKPIGRQSSINRKRKPARHRKSVQTQVISLSELNRSTITPAQVKRPTTVEVIRYNRSKMRAFLKQKSFEYPPRAFQKRILTDYAAADESIQTVLFPCATGIGKTYLAAILAKVAASNKNTKTLVLTPRRTILDQIIKEFKQFCGDSVAIGEYGATRTLKRIKKQPKNGKQLFENDIIVATIQGFFDHNSAEDIIETILKYHFTTIIIDEAHESILSGSRNQIIQKLLALDEPPEMLAFTATPYIGTRSPQQRKAGAKSSVYEAIGRSHEDNPIAPFSFRDAIDANGNCPISCGYIIAEDAKISDQIKAAMAQEEDAGVDNEYTSSQLKELVTIQHDKQAAQVLLFGKDRYNQANHQGQGIIFCTGISHANRFAKLLNSQLIEQFSQDMDKITDDADKKGTYLEEAIKDYYGYRELPELVEKIVDADIQNFVDAFYCASDNETLQDMKAIIQSIADATVMPVALNKIDDLGQERLNYLRNHFKNINDCDIDVLRQQWHQFTLAAAVHSKLSEKQNNRLLVKQRQGGIKYLTGADKLIEGYNHPPINNILLLRPSRSERFNIQAIGRGMRIDANQPNKYCRVYIMVFPNVPGQNTFVHNITDHSEDTDCEFSYGMDKIPGLTKFDPKDERLIFSGSQLKNSRLYVPPIMVAKATRQHSGNTVISESQRKLNQYVLAAIQDIENAFADLSDLTSTGALRIIEGVTPTMDDAGRSEPLTDAASEADRHPINSAPARNKGHRFSGSGISRDRHDGLNSISRRSDQLAHSQETPPDSATLPSARNMALITQVNRLIEFLTQQLQPSNHALNHASNIRSISSTLTQKQPRFFKPSRFKQLVRKLEALKQVNLTMDEDAIQSIIDETKALAFKFVEKKRNQRMLAQSQIGKVRQQLVDQLLTPGREEQVLLDKLINQGFQSKKESENIRGMIVDAEIGRPEIRQAALEKNAQLNTFFHWMGARIIRFTYECELFSYLFLLLRRQSYSGSRNHTDNSEQAHPSFFLETFIQAKNQLDLNFLDVFVYFNCGPLTKHKKIINLFLRTLFDSEIYLKSLYDRENPVYAFDGSLAEKIKTVIFLQDSSRRLPVNDEDFSAKQFIKLKLYLVKAYLLPSLSLMHIQQLLSQGLIQTWIKELNAREFFKKVNLTVLDWLYQYFIKSNRATEQERAQVCKLYEEYAVDSWQIYENENKTLAQIYFVIKTQDKSLSMVQKLKRDLFDTSRAHRDWYGLSWQKEHRKHFIKFGLYLLREIEQGNLDIFSKDYLNCDAFQFIVDIYARHLASYVDLETNDCLLLLYIIRKVHQVEPEALFEVQAKGNALMSAMMNIHATSVFWELFFKLCWTNGISINRLIEPLDKPHTNLIAIGSVQAYCRGEIKAEQIHFDALIYSDALTFLPKDYMGNADFMTHLIRGLSLRIPIIPENGLALINAQSQKASLTDDLKTELDRENDIHQTYYFEAHSEAPLYYLFNYLHLYIKNMTSSAYNTPAHARNSQLLQKEFECLTNRYQTIRALVKQCGITYIDINKPHIVIRECLTIGTDTFKVGVDMNKFYRLPAWKGLLSSYPSDTLKQGLFKTLKVGRDKNLEYEPEADITFLNNMKAANQRQTTSQPTLDGNQIMAEPELAAPVYPQARHTDETICIDLTQETTVPIEREPLTMDDLFLIFGQDDSQSPSLTTTERPIFEDDSEFMQTEPVLPSSINASRSALLRQSLFPTDTDHASDIFGEYPFYPDLSFSP